MTIGTVLFLLATAIVLFMARTVIMRFLKDNLLINLSKETYAKSVIIFISLIAFLLLYTGGYFRVNERESSNNDSYVVSQAFRDAKKGIKKMLKSPSSAKFANEFDDETKYKINSDGSIIIQSYVDSQNSFGAMIRTHYRCTVRNGEIEDVVTW